MSKRYPTLESPLLEPESFTCATVDALWAHLAILDESGEIVAVNRAWREFAKANHAQFAKVCEGANYLSVCDAAVGSNCEEAQQVAAHIRSIICGREQVCSIEYPCHSPKEKRWFVARITRFSVDSGVRVVVTHENITERKQAEEALKESEAIYKTIFDGAAEGIFVADIETKRLLFLNTAACMMFGYTEEEFLRLEVPDMFAKEDLDYAMAEFGAHAHGKKALTTDLSCRRKDGSKFYANVNSSLMTLSDRLCIVGFFTDITERKLAEEQALIFRRFAEAAGQGFGMATLQGKILYWNQTLCRMFDEYNLEEVYKKEFYEYYPPEFREHILKEMIPKVMNMGQWEGELPAISTKGKEIPTIANAFLIYDEQGKPFRLAVVITDISERKQMENDLHEAKDLAEAANRAKSEFLANMSHEIRTPMTAILGYADLLMDENIGRTTREYVAVIKHNSKHLLRVINDILDLSKIEAGKLQIEKTRCSPVQVVAEVVSLIRPQATAKQLTLKTELAQPLPESVFTDPLRLRQVLVNLMGNAIKFTDRGEVRLGVRLVARDEGTVPFSANENQNTIPHNARMSLCFDITDTGIGMNEEQVGKLFQPFCQVDSSSTRKFGGTGLGLCISKHLAESLGGDIEVHSEPGKGSTFSVTIDPGPLHETQMVYNAQESMFDNLPTTTAATLKKIVLHGRILLAEDGLDNQRLIILLLKTAGADVTAVENGKLAMETALAARNAGEPFDVILMDMQMPVMDGYEATRKLRERGYSGPIVALTAHAMAEDCQKCLDAGCDDYASKPIDREKLLATVANWTARGHDSKVGAGR